MSQILIVDDDANQRELLTWEFSDEGYIVDSASDGREALQKVKMERPDVVILGLSMQGVNGIDTLSQILSLQRRPAVVIHSTHERCQSNYLAKTANAFVIRSSDLAPLKASVREQIRPEVVAA